MNAREVVDEVAGIAELVRHIRRRLGELHRAYGPEPDEDDQLENPPAISACTAIRSALESARASLEPVEASLAEIEALGVGAEES